MLESDPRPPQQVGGAGRGGELHPGQVVLESDPRPPQCVGGAGRGGELHPGPVVSDYQLNCQGS